MNWPVWRRPGGRPSARGRGGLRARWPERFVVLGDAVCAFNPIYGQGMSTAAIAAEILDHCLREQRQATTDLNGLARRFQRRLARRNADAWDLSTGADLRFPTTTGSIQ